MIAHGKNGNVSFDGYFVHISRKNHTNTLLNQGIQGDRSIVVRAITAIEFLDPRGRHGAGFISFDFPGKNPPRGGIFDAMADENAVVFTPNQTEAFIALRNIIMQAIAYTSPPAPAQAPPPFDYSAEANSMAHGPTDQEPLPQTAPLAPPPLVPSPSDRWGQERLK